MDTRVGYDGCDRETNLLLITNPHYNHSFIVDPRVLKLSNDCTALDATSALLTNALGRRMSWMDREVHEHHGSSISWMGLFLMYKQALGDHTDEGRKEGMRGDDTV